ncbi:MAG: glycosyltransferase family 39 protein [Nitrospinota bacterium]|nr:glycosyltransferase family 39 protein [Nitrospinota bacterium]
MNDQIETADRSSHNHLFHLKVFLPLYALFILLVVWWKLSAGMYFQASDGVYYMGVARDIATGKGYYARAIAPVQLPGKPAQTPPFRWAGITNKPLYLFLEAGVFKIFGATTDVAFFTSFFFYAVTGLAIFALVLRLWGPVAAWTSVLLLQTSDEIMFLSTTNHVDTAYIFLVTMAILLTFPVDGKRAWMAGALIALVCLTRPNGIVLAFTLSALVVLMQLVSRDAFRPRIRRLAVFLLPVILANAYMFGYNHVNYGGILRYYDLGGSEFRPSEKGTEDPGAKAISDVGNKDSSLFQVIERSGAVAKLLADRSYKMSMGLFDLDPYRTTIFALGLLWPLIWLRERDLRLAIMAVLGAYIIQMIVTSNLPNVLRSHVWMDPMFCVAAGVMIRDIVRMAMTWRAKYARTALLTLIGALLLSAVMATSGRYVLKTLEPHRLEAYGAQKEWLASMDSLEPILPKGSVLVAPGTINVMMAWRLPELGVSLEDLGEFETLLLAADKLRTDNFFHVTSVPPDVFVGREGECRYNGYAEAAPYAKLFFQNRFFCMYQLDVKAIRADFAGRIANLEG